MQFLASFLFECKGSHAYIMLYNLNARLIIPFVENVDIENIENIETPIFSRTLSDLVCILSETQNLSTV